MIVSHKRVHNFVDVNGQPRSPWRAGRHSRGCLCWKSMVPDPRHADRRQSGEAALRPTQRVGLSHFASPVRLGW